MEESRGLRRSARLSALDTCKTNKTTHNVGPVEVPRGRGGRRREKTGTRDRRETSSSSRRGRKRKPSTGALEQTTFSSAEEDALAEEHDDSSSYNIGNSSRSRSWLPEKRVLELILDALQKRDLHEMFAKPVDPKKVEDYYEVIQNPVDFGKIRAKLEAGMYESLKQFEEDVFVMFNNAMNFNDSNTLFYRQARSLLDLAKKIFHALKTNPSNFESQLLSMKPKRGRPSKNSNRGGILLSEGEPTRTDNDNNIAAIDISRGRHRSVMNGASGLLKEKMAESSTIMLGLSPRLNNRRTANDDFSGLGYGHKYTSSEIEPRDTYMPVSSNSAHCRPLIYVGQCNVGYIDSLARFTSDLGPSAQMIALKRLRGMSEKHAVSPYSTAPPMPRQQQQLQGSAPCTITAPADHARESSCRPPHGRIEIPPSVYCPPRFGIPNERHKDAVAANLNHAFGSMSRTTSAGSLNPMSEKALISRQPPAATSSIHAFRSETPPPPPFSSCMRHPSTTQQQQAATPNSGEPDDPPTSCAPRNITYSRRHAGLDVLPALGGPFMPAADQARKPSFSPLPAASQVSPVSPNPLLAYNFINDGSWSSLPAAQMNPTVEAANYSFTDFLATTNTRNENFLAPAAAAIPDSGNNIYMAMMAAASAMSPSCMQQLRLSTGDPESDSGGQPKLLELASRNNNPTLLPLMLPSSTAPASAAQVTNLLPDHLDGGENNQGGAAAGGLMMNSHDQGLSVGQSSAWGQTNVGMHDTMSSLEHQYFPQVGEVDYSWGLDGFTNSLLQLRDRRLPVPETLFFNAMVGGERGSRHGRHQFEPSVNPPLSDTTQLPDLALQL